MEKYMTTNYLGFDRAAKESWYLTCLSAKPAPKVKIRLADGRTNIYKGKNTVKPGDVAVIGHGCKSSFEMGEVVQVSAASGGKSFLRNVQYVFASNPSQNEIKKMGGKIFNYQDPDTVFKKVIPGAVQFEVNIPMIDIEVENLLFACCALAHEKLATPATIEKAKSCLETPKYLCGELFGDRMDELINRCSGPVLSFDFSGYYPDWEKKIPELAIDGEMAKVQKLRISKSAIRFERASTYMEGFIREQKEFAGFYNELIFHSALAILIRGGFANLLDAALRVHMPIDAFYGELIDLSKAIDSKHCQAILEEHKAEYI